MYLYNFKWIYYEYLENVIIYNTRITYKLNNKKY